MVNKMSTIKELATLIECEYNEEEYEDMLTITRVVDGVPELFEVWGVYEEDEHLTIIHIPSNREFMDVSECIENEDYTPADVLVLCDKLVRMPHRRKTYLEPIKHTLQYHNNRLEDVVRDLKEHLEDDNNTEVRVGLDDNGDSIIYIDTYTIESHKNLYDRVKDAGAWYDDIEDFQQREYYKMQDENMKLMNQVIAMVDEVNKLKAQQRIVYNEIINHPCYKPIVV